MERVVEGKFREIGEEIEQEKQKREGLRKKCRILEEQLKQYQESYEGDKQFSKATYKNINVGTNNRPDIKSKFVNVLDIIYLFRLFRISRTDYRVWLVILRTVEDINELRYNRGCVINIR